MKKLNYNTKFEIKYLYLFEIWKSVLNLKSEI